ncbi:MAG: dihydroorotate dehydrogenase electron transfer subunit [Oscillospiraceae bacterium]|nr:dihydroorotate dehydrogenase electron transfer subunit [Oscillospiraceae bacterium]
MIAACDIISNEKLTAEYEIYSMTIDAPKAAQEARPGQFLHVKCDGLTLRRPISIAGAKNGRLEICYDVRGKGTAWMAGLRSGDKIDFIGPLGNGFDVFGASRKVLLAGGGAGVFPLRFAAGILGDDAVAVLGFRTKGLVTFEKEFAECKSELHITTDDGSYGKKGFVTDAVKEVLDSREIGLIMTCGPKIMMEAVALEAAGRNIRCQVSLEERMACGVGACLACACRVKNSNKRVCADGPVFLGDEVDWNW